MNRILCLTVMVCIYVSGFGQTGNAPKSESKINKIYIDSRLPNINLGKFIRYKDSSARLSDFYNKIIILDFWFTHCTACIAQFPKEDSLQQEFNKDIQIIPVAYEPEDVINNFLHKWEFKSHRKLSLPFIVEDTLLNSHFGNVYFPHYVWISQDRRIIAQTSEYFLTKQNIEALLKESGHLKEKLKKDRSLLNTLPHLNIDTSYNNSKN